MEDFSQKIILNGKHQQLIDLNKDKVNFSCEFTITPNIMDLDKTYYATVVTQDQLDKDENISFSKMSGIHEGSVSNDSNQYQNYFLVIKSDVPMKEALIENKIRELPSYNEPEPEQEQELRIEPDNEYIVQQKNKQIIESYKIQNDSNNKNIKYIILFFILVCGGFLLYYFWKKSKKTDLKYNEPMRFKSPSIKTYEPKRFNKSPKSSPIRTQEPKNLIEQPKRFSKSPIRTHEPLRTRMFEPSSPALSTSSEVSIGKSPKFNFERF